MRRNWASAKKKCEREGVCRYCQSFACLPLQPAHLWHRGMGAGRGIDLMNDDLIIPLGEPCHTLFDQHRIDVLPILSLNEQVALVSAAGGIETARRRVCPLQYKRELDESRKN